MPKPLHMFVLGGLTAVVTACSGPQLDSDLLEAHVEPLRPPTPIAQTDRLFRLQVGTVHYAIVDGDEAEQIAELRIEQQDDAWVRHAPGGRITHLTVDAAGNIIVTAVEDLDHDVITRYDPPLMLMPAALEPNKPIIIESSMTIVDRDDPARQVDEGTCRQLFVHDGDQVVMAPAGRFDCHRIRMKYRAKLRFAEVTTQTVRHYA
ncbi:MAG: hypothetical protein QF735_12070, partial [Phycisphaeraceae bacterium]|nr:hypothetical protein [Phycisphaeraceae bacterium]